MFSHVKLARAVLTPGKGEDSATRVGLPGAAPGNGSLLTNQGKKTEEEKKALSHPGPPGVKQFAHGGQCVPGFSEDSGVLTGRRRAS